MQSKIYFIKGQMNQSQIFLKNYKPSNHKSNDLQETLHVHFLSMKEKYYISLTNEARIERFLILQYLITRVLTI